MVNSRASSAVLVVALLATGACGSSSDSTTRTSSTARAGSVETWDEHAQGGPITESAAVLRETTPPPCTTLDIGGTQYAVLWPSGSSRTSDGVTVDGHLFRFGRQSKFRGREYLAPRRTTACVAAKLWMVIGAGTPK